MNPDGTDRDARESGWEDPEEVARWDDFDAQTIGRWEDPDALPEKSLPGYVRIVAALLAIALFVFFANLFFQLVL